MSGISIHVVDVSRGVVAAGMQIELCRMDGTVVASGITNAKGLLEHPALVGPEEMSRILNAYYEPLVSLLRARGGDVMKQRPAVAHQILK